MSRVPPAPGSHVPAGGSETGGSAETRRGIFDAELLDRCISCGFCLPACPTYALTGDEKSSPRGRINLMRALETGVLPDDDATLQEESSFCLGCRACEPVCPAGVQYGALLEEWRDHQWSGRRRPVLSKIMTVAVAQTRLVETIGALRPHARTRRREPGASAARVAEVEERSDLAPSLMLGCFERGLFPEVSRAAKRVRPELQVPVAQGCCGALAAHNGDLEQGRRLARELGDALPGLIITTAGGCAAHVAETIGRDRLQEFSQYVVGSGATETPGALGEVLVDGRRARVALQDSCHLRNGLAVWREPRELISAVATYVELPSAAVCCGSAGSYSILRPRDSRRVLDPKLDEIIALDVDYVVTVNPGCTRQLRSGLRRRRSRTKIIHIAELLDLPSRARSGGSVLVPPALHRVSSWLRSRRATARTKRSAGWARRPASRR